MVLMTLSDAARIYRIPPGTLRRWLSEGRLTRHGTKPYRVDLAEVERLANPRR